MKARTKNGLNDEELIVIFMRKRGYRLKYVLPVLTYLVWDLLARILSVLVVLAIFSPCEM